MHERSNILLARHSLTRAPLGCRTSNFEAKFVCVGAESASERVWGGEGK